MEFDIDWESLQIDIVTSLRGTRSASELSRILGFAYNKVDRWESGISSLSWQDFIALSAAVNFDVMHLLKDYFSYSGDPSSVSKIFACIFPTLNITQLSTRLDVPKQTISRWLKDTGSVKMIDVLKALKSEVGFLDFLCHLSPSLWRIRTLREKHLEIHRQHPYVGVILRAIEILNGLGEKSTNVDLISQRTGESPENISAAIDELLAIDALQKVDDCYEISPTIQRVRTNELRDHLVNYWLQRGINSIAKEKVNRGYCNLALNDEGIKQLEKLISNFFSELSDLSCNFGSKPSNIRNITVQIFDPESIGHTRGT